jgi:hypothetical protein
MGSSHSAPRRPGARRRPPPDNSPRREAPALNGDYKNASQSSSQWPMEDELWRVSMGLRWLFEILLSFASLVSSHDENFNGFLCHISLRLQWESVWVRLSENVIQDLSDNDGGFAFGIHWMVPSEPDGFGLLIIITLTWIWMFTIQTFN